MAKSGVSELRKPWTDCHKIWHGWLRRRYDRVCQNLKRSPQCGHPGKWVKYHARVVFSFFLVLFFVTPFLIASRLQKLNCRSVKLFWRSLIHITHQSQVIAFIGAKTPKSFIFPHFYPPKKNTQKGAWIGIFKPNSHNIENRISQKLQWQLQPNFAQR